LAEVTSPLRSPRLRVILAAYTVNRLGSWIGLVALSLAVFDHTHDTLAVAGLLLAWQALPAFLVPALVARVEASKRHHELSALYIFEGLVTALIAILLGHFWLPAVLLLAVADGTAALAANALLRAEVARVARDEVMRAPTAGDGRGPPGSLEAEALEAERLANAALNVCFSVSFVAGPVIGGVVVAAAGAPAALFIDVGSFLLCGLLLLNLHPHVEEAGADTIRERLKRALAHINETPVLRGLLLIQTLALVLIQAAAPIEVSYVKATLHGGDRGYGVFVTSWGAGVVLASILFARAKHRALGPLLAAGTFALGAAFIGFAAAPTLALACLAAFIGGIGNGLGLPSLISLVQQLAPGRLHGLLMGGVESMMALTLAVGLPLGGALVAIGSPRIAFLVLGIGTALMSSALFRATSRGSVMPAESHPDAPATDTGRA
jgi:MFS family permease